MAEPWFVYILASATRPTLYTGVSNDPVARLVKHNTGRGAVYTRVGRPWEIVYIEQVATRGDALRREYAIKNISRDEKLRLAFSYLERFISPASNIMKPSEPAAASVRRTV